MNEQQPSKPKKGTSTKPVHVVRFGAIAASIWERQSNAGYAYFDFSLSRSYKSLSSGKEGYSTNYFGKNQEDLKNAIDGATAWIASKESTLETKEAA